MVLRLTRQGKTCRTRNIPSWSDWAFLLCLGSYQLKLSTLLSSLENWKLVLGRQVPSNPSIMTVVFGSFWPLQLKPFTLGLWNLLFFVCQCSKSFSTSSCYPYPWKTTSLRVTMRLGKFLSDPLNELPAPFGGCIIMIRASAAYCSIYCAGHSYSDRWQHTQKIKHAKIIWIVQRLPQSCFEFIDSFRT